MKRGLQLTRGQHKAIVANKLMRPSASAKRKAAKRARQAYLDQLAAPIGRKDGKK